MVSNSTLNVEKFDYGLNAIDTTIEYRLNNFCKKKKNIYFYFQSDPLTHPLKILQNIKK